MFRIIRAICRAGGARAPLVWNVYVGASGAAIWLIILGAWLATYLGASDGMVATNAAGNSIFPHLGTLTVLVSVAALTATMGLNAYSGMLTLVTGLDCFANIPFSRGVRIARRAGAGCGVAGGVAVA